MNKGLINYVLPAILVSAGLIFSACKEGKKEPEIALEKGTYGYDADFLKKHTKKIIELSDSSGAKILLSADYQGRVMTSTANGDSGASYGWINYELIASHEWKKQFNPVGGEERFWLGPEGGQYSIYFAPGDSFNINKWQVPAIIDTVSYDVVETSPIHANFTKNATLINHNGTRFDIEIERSVILMSKDQLEQLFKTEFPEDVKCVGYATGNGVRNVGENAWTREGGALSIWLLGMMNPTPNTTVIIPFKSGPDSKQQVSTNYFGEIPTHRLKIGDSVLFFKCDGKYRSKLGLTPDISKGLAASFDSKENVLTIINFPVYEDASYVNSKWEIQKEPYKGDVVNSYNDGPLADGSQLGPFYELESSSQALVLEKREQGMHIQTTVHLEGSFESLNTISKAILGVDLNDVR